MEERSLFILTHCAAEDNYTPRAFKTFKDARKAMIKTYEDEVNNHEELIFESDIYTNGAIIIWTDDTYDKFKIFEIEVE